MLGAGSIDYGDTPAYPGVYDASAAVVGAALEGLERVMSGEVYRTFQPIGGLHHARRGSGAGFCVFNDCGVVIDTLREKYGISAWPTSISTCITATGFIIRTNATPKCSSPTSTKTACFCIRAPATAEEAGKGEAAGTKLNIPMQPGAGDKLFMREWERVVEFLRNAQAGVHRVPVRRRQPRRAIRSRI